MRVTGISCVRNEEDIVEAFVRHTLVYCREFIVIENGSTDSTPGILQRLKDEGLAVHVIPDATIGNVQVDHMNRLVQMAARDFSADWIISVDADEFIAGQRTAEAFLPEPAGDDLACLRIPLRSYYTSPDDPPGILNPVERITKRLIREPAEVAETDPRLYKIIIPGKLALLPESYISQGNHLFYINGKAAPSRILKNAWLAHFSLRSPRQYAMKTVVKHCIKFCRVSTKGDETPFYEKAYAQVRKSYASFARDFHHQHIPYMPPHDTTAVISDPVEYLGGPLRYTTPRANDSDLFVEQLLDFAEALALANGKNGAGEAVEKPESAPKLLFEVSNGPGRGSGHVHIVETGPAVKHTLNCPLDSSRDDDSIRLRFQSEPGLVEISEITLFYSAGGEMERTFGFVELGAMLRVVTNAAAIHCEHVYRLLISSDPATVIFSGWRRDGEPAPSALRIKLRHENRLVPATILSASTLNAITRNSADHERFSPRNPANIPPDCIDFPVNFTSLGNAFYFTGEGWGPPEPWGTWTVGERAVLTLNFSEPPSRALKLTARLKAFAGRPGRKLRVHVHLDGAPIATWTPAGPRFKQFSARIPAGKIKSRQSEIRFEIDSPVSPMELDAESTDSRKLGAGFQSMTIQHSLF